MDTKFASVLVGALALRMILFSVPSLSQVLDGRVEITTPVSSYKRREYKGSKLNVIGINECVVLEGLFQYSHGVSPYDGGVYHQVSPSGLNLHTTNVIVTAISSPIFDFK